MTCTHNCNQGKACTCSQRGELPNPTEPLSDAPSAGTVFWAIAYVALAYVLAIFIAPFLAGWGLA